MGSLIFMCNEFLEKGSILKGSTEIEKKYFLIEEGRLKDIELVGLINEGSEYTLELFQVVWDLDEDDNWE